MMVYLIITVYISFDEFTIHHHVSSSFSAIYHMILSLRIIAYTRSKNDDDGEISGIGSLIIFKSRNVIRHAYGASAHTKNPFI